MSGILDALFKMFPTLQTQCWSEGLLDLGLYLDDHHMIHFRRKITLKMMRWGLKSLNFLMFRNDHIAFLDIDLRSMDKTKMGVCLKKMELFIQKIVTVFKYV